MAQSYQPTENSTNNLNIPLLFVYADNKNNFEEEIHIDCFVTNVSKIQDDVLTSNILFVQSLPFVIEISREKKDVNRRNGTHDELHIELCVNKEIGPFSSQFSYQICAIKSKCHPIEFETSYKRTLKHTHNTIVRVIQWEQVANLKHLKFRINLSVAVPKGGYYYPSRAATGYHGLRNEGATCYVNAMLQSLFYTNAFRRIVYNIPLGPDEAEANKSFVFWLKFIFYSMQFDGEAEIRTNKMIECFEWEDMNEQQDIQEFLRRLMDKLDQFVDGTEFKTRLEQLFVGKLEITTKCEAVNIVNVTEEPFWDLQMSLDVDDIFGAFCQYLEPLHITEFDYGGGKDTAIRQFKFLRMPPVLHITLNRFNFNAKTRAIQKNNNQFEFYPKLDLSPLCEDAKYTLHSVLVHSGKTTSGHYIAYICPRADNEWFLFNDQTVTKCTLDDAVNCNYGNGTSNTNAYMLVYIKDNYISEILREVSIDDVIAKDLIDKKIAERKEKRKIQIKYQGIEVVVYTTERLQMDNQLKRGVDITDIKSSKTFWMEKNKTVGDIRESIGTMFSLGSSQDTFPLWLINEGGLVRYCDNDDILKSKLSKFANEKRIHFFVELPSMETTPDVFDATKHALIFIKEYNYSSKSLTFFGHHYIDINQTAQSVREYICSIIAYNGSEDDIALIYENFRDGEYSYLLLDATQKISKFVNQFEGTFSAMVTFELLENYSKPKYLSPVFDANSPSNQCQITRAITAKVPEIKNGIKVTIKNATYNRDEELFSREFDDQTELIEIIQQICKLSNISIDAIQLLDMENNVIDGAQYGYTIEEFMKKNTKGAITRRRIQKGLTFAYSVNDMFQPDKEFDQLASNETSINESLNISEPVPMEYEVEDEYEPCRHVLDQSNVVREVFRTSPKSDITITFRNADILNDSFDLTCKRTELLSDIAEKFQQRAKKDLNQVEFSTQDCALLEMLDDIMLETILDENSDHLQIGFRIDETQGFTHTANQSTPTSTNSIDENDCRSEKKLYLDFEDRAKVKVPIALDFSGEENLKLAINQIIDVMDLDKSTSRFYDSNGNEITEDLLDISVSEFLENNAPKINYAESDYSRMRMQRTDKHGKLIDWQYFDIDKSTTVQDLLNKESSNGKHRVLKVKDGIIHSIVAPEIRLITLIGDNFKYRLDQYEDDFCLHNREETFYVCVSFVGKIPKDHDGVPILVEMAKYTSLRLLGIRVLKYLGKVQIDREKVENFQYTVNDDMIIPSPDGLMSDAKLLQPEDPSIIPVVKLNMNEENKNKRHSYSFFWN